MKTLTLTTQLTRDNLEPMFDVARVFSLTFSNFVFDEDDIVSYDIHLPESLTREEWHTALREFQLDEVTDFSDELFGKEEN